MRRIFEAYATGRFSQQQVLEQARACGPTNRRNRPLTLKRLGKLLYAGIVDVPDTASARCMGLRAADFDGLFYRVQAVLAGRVPSTTRQQRAHPESTRSSTCSRPRNGRRLVSSGSGSAIKTRRA